MITRGNYHEGGLFTDTPPVVVLSPGVKNQGGEEKEGHHRFPHLYLQVFNFNESCSTFVQLLFNYCFTFEACFI